jgi:hypothetical protein
MNDLCAILGSTPGTYESSREGMPQRVANDEQLLRPRIVPIGHIFGDSTTRAQKTKTAERVIVDADNTRESAFNIYYWYAVD